MKKFAKVENNIVVEVIESENAPDSTYIECGIGMRNLVPYPEYMYDPELDIFYIPIMGE